MTEFTSDIKTIPYSDECIFAMLSDLTNLERVKNRIPDDKIKNFTFDRDSCSMEINPVGKVVFTIVDREPNKTVKFEASNLPVPLNLWIQLKSEGPEITKMKMTARTNLNPFLKPMVSKPIQDALDKISDIIASLPYEEQA
jgi:carbon monoxide dehydrogenase subunit G